MDLSSVFESSLNPDPAVRGAAEAQLQSFSSHNGFIPALLQLIFAGESSLSNPVRQAASVYLKNRVVRAYKETPAEDRTLLKSSILESLAAAPPKLKPQFTTVLATILNYDFPDEWESLLPQVITLLHSQDSSQLQAGLEALVEIVRCYKFRRDKKSRSQASSIVQQTLPLLPPLGQNILASVAQPHAPQSQGYLLYLIFKIYKLSIITDLPPCLQEEQSVSAWGMLLLQTVQRQIAESEQPEDFEDRERFSWWKAKKWAYFILNFLHSRYGTPSSLTKFTQNYLPFATNFQENLAPTILKTYLDQIDLYVNQKVFLSQRVIQLIIAFCNNSTKPKSTWSLLKPHLDTLIQHFIFPVLCLSSEEADLINDEPIDFVKEHYVEFKTDYFKSPVTSALDFIGDLASTRKNVLLPILSFITSIASQHPEKYNSIQKDGAFRMLLPLASVLVGDEKLTRDVESFMVQYVIPDLASEHPLLRARACEVLEKFEKETMTWENTENLNKLFQGITGLLTDPSIPVRIRAVLVLPELVRYDEVHKAISPSIGRIMQEIFELLNTVDLDSLSNTSRILVAYFSTELVPFCCQLSTQLVNSVIRLLNELLEIRNVASAEIDDVNDDKMLTAMGAFKTAHQLVLALETSPDHLAQCESIFIPALEMVIVNQFSELYDEVFELIDSLIFWQKKVSPPMWNLFQQLHGCLLRGEGVDCAEDILVPLENYAAYGGDALASNEQYQNLIVDVYRIIMTNDRTGATDRVAACKLAETLILCNKGKVNNCITPILTITAPFVFREDFKSDPFITTDLHLRAIRIFIGAIYYDTLSTIHWLEQQQQQQSSSSTSTSLLQIVFQKWFASLHNLNHVHEKKLSILAISSMIGVIHSLPELVKQSCKDIIAVALTLFNSLPGAIKTREKKEAEFSAGLDDVSDDDEDGEIQGVAGALADDDEDVKEIDHEYDDMLFMKRQARLRKEANEDGEGGIDGEGILEGEDDEDDGFETEDEDSDAYDEEVLYESPLEELDSYVSFKMALQEIDRTNPQLLHSITASLDQDQNEKLREVMTTADSGGEQVYKPKDQKQKQEN